MPRPINWHLPQAVHSWLNTKFPGQGDSPAKDVVRRHLGGLCEYELALKWNTTKTGVYRNMLCREFPELEAIWPPLTYTPAQLEAMRRRTLPTAQLKVNQPKPPNAGKYAAILKALRDDVVNLSTPQIRARLDTIIKKLEQ